MTTNWQSASRAFGMRRGRSAHDADDLVQEAWVRLACYEREQTVAKPEAFLMRTTFNRNRPTNAVIDGGPVQMSTSGRSKPNPTRQV